MSDEKNAPRTTASDELERATDSAASTTPEPATQPEAAKAAEEMPARRRVRRSRHVDAPVIEAEPPAEAEADADSASAGEVKERKPRERRTSRSAAGRSTGAKSDEEKTEEDGPRKPRGRARERAGGAAGRRPQRAKGRAVGASSKRGVYRQDVVTPADAKKLEEAEKKAAAVAKAKKAEEDSKITLILHPAPKAAPQRRKKKDRPLTAKEALKAKTALKKKPDKRTDKASKAPAQTELKEAWVQADGDTAAEVILEAGTQADQLIRAWLDAGNAIAIATAASTDGVAGKLRKSARRALGVLKSRGVDIPKITEPVATKTAPEPEVCVATFIPPDATGTTFFSISQRQPGGRYKVADVMVRDELGVVHASSGQLPGKQIRRWRNRVEKRFGTPPIDVPVEWARYRIAQGRKKNDETDQLVPLGFDNCQSLISPIPEEVPAHPVAELEVEQMEEEKIKEASKESEALHNDPEFSGWLPDKPALDELLSRMGQRVGSENAEDKELIDTVLREEVASATDRFFTPEVRKQVAERMRDSAISVRQRSGDDAARRVLATARAVREAGLITQPPSDIPFLLSYFQKGVAVLARQGQGQLRLPPPPAD